MKLHTNPLNDAGQQVMEIHREYHNPDIPELHKSALLALASERLGKQKLAWKKAFCNPDPLDLVSLLAKKRTIRLTRNPFTPTLKISFPRFFLKPTYMSTTLASCAISVK